jgi:hypothetical protein
MIRSYTERLTVPDDGGGAERADLADRVAEIHQDLVSVLAQFGSRNGSNIGKLFVAGIGWRST